MSNTKHMQNVIARLHREIDALLAKPAPQRSNYETAARWKHALTVRQHALAQRATLIREYEKRIENTK